MRPTLWTIVLAAGAGQRLASVTGGIPKQFWSADGGPTLLEDTLARTARLTPPDRTIIVVDHSHRRFVQALPDLARRGRVIYQPCDRGTAAGVLFGLSEVVATDAHATVLLVPSDHGMVDPAHFIDGVRAVIADVEATHARVVLFGAAPSRPDRDYGWITPHGRATVRGLRRVSAFIEKPDMVTAVRLYDSGAVWNTMVLVARARTLLELYRQQVPELAVVFEPSLTLDQPERREYLQARYAALPRADFSRDVVGRTRELFVRTWPAEMGWSDLGTPERLARWRASRAEAAIPGTGRERVDALQLVGMR